MALVKGQIRFRRVALARLVLPRASWGPGLDFKGGRKAEDVPVSSWHDAPSPTDVKMLPRRSHLLQIGHSEARAWRQTLLLGFQQHQADSGSPFKPNIYESPEDGNRSNTLNANLRKTVRKIWKPAITQSLYCSLWLLSGAPGSAWNIVLELCYKMALFFLFFA